MSPHQQEALYNSWFIPPRTRDQIKGMQARAIGTGPGRPVDLFPGGYQESIERRAGITRRDR